MKKNILAFGLLLAVLCVILAGCSSISDNKESSTDSGTSGISSLVYTLPAAGGTSSESSSESVAGSSAANAGVSGTGTSISSSIPYGDSSSSSTDAASSANYETGTYTVNTATDPLSLRLAPSGSGDTTTICTIPKGTKVEVLAVKGEWGYVVYGKTGGWVAMKYLKPAV